MPTLTKFDPQQPLVANTFFRLHAVGYAKGDAVPYSDADHRILERLYMRRKLGYGQGEPVDTRSPRQKLLDGPGERREQVKAAKANAAEIELAATQQAIAAVEPSEEEAAAVKTLVNRNSHEVLFTKARGIAGVTKDQTKGEIALALVRAGRGPA
jgi:hypothetical protein